MLNPLFTYSQNLYIALLILLVLGVFASSRVIYRYTHPVLPIISKRRRNIGVLLVLVAFTSAILINPRSAPALFFFFLPFGLLTIATNCRQVWVLQAASSYYTSYVTSVMKDARLKNIIIWEGLSSACLMVLGFFLFIAAPQSQDQGLPSGMILGLGMVYAGLAQGIVRIASYIRTRRWAIRTSAASQASTDTRNGHHD